jgi:hypothetical protein
MTKMMRMLVGAVYEISENARNLSISLSDVFACAVGVLLHDDAVRGRFEDSSFILNIIICELCDIIFVSRFEENSHISSTTRIGHFQLRCLVHGRTRFYLVSHGLLFFKK